MFDRTISPKTKYTSLLAGLFTFLGLCPGLAVHSAWPDPPQNMILMIGDGLGMESVWAAGAYQFGSDYHKFGGQEKLRFEKLSGFCWMTTYPLNLSTSPTNEPSSRVSYDPDLDPGRQTRPTGLSPLWSGIELQRIDPRGTGERVGNGDGRKAYATDSGASATALACGIKTFYHRRRDG